MASGKVKIAWVIPWYGENIPGGAEAECRSTAKALARAGHQVEILTTCVREFLSDWTTNHHKPGVERLGGITIRRFKVNSRDQEAFDRVNLKLMRGRLVSREDEQVFMSNMIHSDDLVSFIRQHKNEYVFLPIPYMFGTTHSTALACPDRTVLVPCLHDEAYAYMNCFREMFLKVRGALYHVPAEKRLAEKLYGLEGNHGILVGEGIDSDFTFDAARFRAKYGSAPFLLYAGRKEEGKNVPLLIEYFCQYKERFGGDLRLILLGGGRIDIPSSHLNSDVIDLGFVSKQDKCDAYAAALALCQPSLMESFSIVMMEAWLAGCPTLVHRDCEVTLDHCEASQGGLYFRSFQEFSACLRFFLENPSKRARMGQNGAEYVRLNFTWPVVIQRYEQALKLMGFDLA